MSSGGGDCWIRCKPEVHAIPELLELIFHHLQPSTLSPLRLVCKIWNCEISRYFQKRTHVRLNNIYELNGFTDILKNNLKLNLPLPFSLFTVCIDFTRHWNLYLQQFLSVPTTSRFQLNLKIFDLPKTKYGSEQRKLADLLAMPVLSDILISLEFGCYKLVNLNLGVPREIGTEEKCDFNFGKLSKFFCGGIPSCEETVWFVIQIVNSSGNLSLLSLGSEIQEEFLRLIFLRANLKSIQTLEFDISKSVLPLRSSLEKVKSMIVLFDSFNAEAEGVERFNCQRELLHNFSDVLQELKVFWNPKEINLSSKGFPLCERLEKLIIHNWGSHIGAFHQSKLPQLREISFSQDVLLTDNFNVVRANHPLVEKVSFNRGVGYPNEMIPAGLFNRFLRHVSLQFPNVSNLHLTWDIRLDTINILTTHFRHLTHLELVSRLGFEEPIFTGYGRNHLHGILLGHEGSVTRKPCLIDLQHLKTLRIEHMCGRKSVQDSTLITNNGIKYGLARMHNLLSLKMNWNNDLSLDNLLSSLSHLESIELIIDKNQVSSKIYKRLLLRWPQIKLKEIKNSESQTSWVSWFVTRVWSTLIGWSW